MKLHYILTQNHTSLICNVLLSTFAFCWVLCVCMRSVCLGDNNSAVCQVAEAIWGSELCSVDLILQAAATAPNLGTPSRPTPTQIWTVLWQWSTERSRPAAFQNNLSNLGNTTNTAAVPHLLIVAVLSNLLDCAVQVPDKALRRQYIGRILTLPKAAQKAIMALIELRSSATSTTPGSSSSRKSPGKQSPVAPRTTTPHSSTSPGMLQQQEQHNQQEQPLSSTRTPYLLPPHYPSPSSIANKEQQQQQRSFTPTTKLPTMSAHDALSRMNCSSAGVGNSSNKSSPGIPATPPPSSNRATSVLASAAATPPVPAPPHLLFASPTTKSSLKKAGDRNHVHSVVFGHPVAAPSLSVAFSPDQPSRDSHPMELSSTSPDPSRIASSVYHTSTDTGHGSTPTTTPGGNHILLSPGTIESPARMQSVVQHLQRRNELLQQSLSDVRLRESTLTGQLERMASEHRQSTLRLEAQSLDRIQELQREADERATEWQTNLTELREQVRLGSTAVQELQVAKEELEVMQHNKAALVETTEKLRKYKDKVTELQDVKEALRSEQEAHGKAVDDVVRLENELQQLLPVKRQVEDYKIRAIEAEVKLVECQDFLRRMERQANDESTKHETLFKGVILQKEQMEEMQRRIQQDTEHNRDNPVTIHGVGDSLTELNPALRDELVLLRNDNLQLRAFQAKRTEDAVQHLEESLDDTKRLADRYKNEYLDTKETLERTETSLTESLHQADELRVSIRQWQERCEQQTSYGDELERQIEQITQQLNQIKTELCDEQDQSEALQTQVRELTKQKADDEHVSTDRWNQLQATLAELAQIRTQLQSSEGTVDKLRFDFKRLTLLSQEQTQTLQKNDHDLQTLRWELDDTSNKLQDKRSAAEALEVHVAKLHKQVKALDEKLVTEKDQRQEEATEAQDALEATRVLLENKSKKDLDELRSNMNRLLTDEREANRKKDEKANEMHQQLEEDWKAKYTDLEDQSTASLHRSRKEAQERMEYMKKVYEEDIAKLKNDSNEAHEGIIRRGKSVLEEAKAKAKMLLREEAERNDELAAENVELENSVNDLLAKSKALEKSIDDAKRTHEGKVHSLELRLDMSMKKISQHEQQLEEQYDRAQLLQRDIAKLTDENAQYRRQLGGRHGEDSRIQVELDKLQKEFNEVVVENRNYKKQLQNGGTSGHLTSIMESGEEDPDDHRSYRSDGVNKRALAQARKDFEETVEALNDQKREFLMKLSSQATDVHKAEKRVWEHEAEIADLKKENTNLKLQLQRIEMAREEVEDDAGPSENLSPMDSSDHITELGSSSSNTRSRSSPGIDRAKKQKLAQETMLRNRFTSITGTPPRKVQQVNNSSSASSHQVLASHQPNSDHSSSGTELPQIPSRPPSPPKCPRISSHVASKMAFDVYRLGASEKSDFVSQYQNPSISQYTQLKTDPDENGQECKPS